MTIYRIKQETRVMDIVKAFMQGKKMPPSIIVDTSTEDDVPFNIEQNALENITNLIIRKSKGHG